VQKKIGERKKKKSTHLIVQERIRKKKMPGRPSDAEINVGKDPSEKGTKRGGFMGNNKERQEGLDKERSGLKSANARTLGRKTRKKTQRRLEELRSLGRKLLGNKRGTRKEDIPSIACITLTGQE